MGKWPAGPIGREGEGEVSWVVVKSRLARPKEREEEEFLFLFLNFQSNFQISFEFSFEF